MTLRESVTRELLAAVDDPDELDEIFQRYNRSKGPLYLGLAAATTELHDQFETVSQDFRDLTAEKDELNEEVATLREQRIEIEQSVETSSTELQTVEKGLEQARGSLDRLDQLERAGFGEAEFANLHELLAQVAAGQGEPPEKAVRKFFETMQRFDQIVSLGIETERAESEATKAKLEAERWMAEANAREVQSSARIFTIDLVEDLLGQGAKGTDFVSWSEIILRAGVTVEELAVALEGYSGIEALSAARQARAELLQAEVSGLEAQVKVLAQERDDAHQAIVAVRDIALGEVNVAEKQARKHINTMFRDATNYGDLKKEAAELGELIDAARVLKSGNLELWKSLPGEVIQHALAGSIIWARGESRDIQVQAPSAVTQANALFAYMHLSLSHVLLWGLAGVLTDGKQMASLTGR